MNDKCSQFKKDYEKLLELKQEFDKALKGSEEIKDLTEVKRIKE